MMTVKNFKEAIELYSKAPNAIPHNGKSIQEQVILVDDDRHRFKTKCIVGMTFGKNKLTLLKPYWDAEDDTLKHYPTVETVLDFISENNIPDDCEIITQACDTSRADFCHVQSHLRSVMFNRCFTSGEGLTLQEIGDVKEILK